MAALLEASKLNQLGLHVLSSSHLKPLDPEATYKSSLRYGVIQARKNADQAQRNKDAWLPKGAVSNSWGGLIIAQVEYPREPTNFQEMDQRTDESENKFEELELSIKRSICKVSLQVSGTNDFKFLVVKNGVMVPLTSSALEIWGSLPDKYKIKFNPKRHRLFGKDAECHIRTKIQEYVSILGGLYQDSSFEFVFHSSLLERVYIDNEILANLDIYFCYINYWLQVELGKLNSGEGILNKNGVKITWGFLNVSAQFYEEKK